MVDSGGRLEESPFCFVLLYLLPHECIMKVSRLYPSAVNQALPTTNTASPSLQHSHPFPQLAFFQRERGRERISSIRIGIEHDINKARGRQ